MEVDRISAHVPYGHQFKTGVEKAPKLEKTTDDPSTPQAESQPDSQSSVETQETNGVIRLLLEGHFRGVADVRLRINHSEKLLALEQQQLQAVAAEKIDGVLASVGAVVETFLGPDQDPAQSAEESAGQETPVVQELQSLGLLTEDAFTQFTQAVNAVKDEFLNAQSPSKDTLVDNLNSAFQSFVELLAPPSEPAPEIPEESEIPANSTIGPDSVNPDVNENGGIAESVEEPKSLFQSFVENLEAAFATAMDELTSSLNEVKILPELSEPNGNGVAYDKFLAIYNEL